MPKYAHTNTNKSSKYTISDPRLHLHKIISYNIPRRNTNAQTRPQSRQPTHTVLQPRASYTLGLQLRSEDSSLPLNHATLILRTCRLAAFLLHAITSESSAYFCESSTHNWVNISLLLHDYHYMLQEVIWQLWWHILYIDHACMYCKEHLQGCFHRPPHSGTNKG